MRIWERVRRGVTPGAVLLAVVIMAIQIIGVTFADDPRFDQPGGPWGGGPPWNGPDGPGRSPWDDPGPSINAVRLDLDWLGYLLVALGPAALVVRRVFPLTVLTVAGGAIIAYLVIGYPYGPVFLACVIALVNAIWYGRRLIAWGIAVAGMALYLTLEYLFGLEPGPTYGSVITSFLWLLVILLIAETVRFRRERRAASAEARAQEAERRAGEERLRIARELHDVLAHNISMINIQAGVALHLGDDLPDQARTALQAIKDASKETLRELRNTLGVLRRVDEDAPRAPTPTLARLDDLLSRAESPGLSVRKEVVGEPRPLPAGADLAAYRIIQEALTNVHRHAAATTAAVTLEYTDTELTVTIDDDGPGTAKGDAHGAGAGIAGMRERATALGGSLSAGRRITGGFRVRARLPLTAETPATTDGPEADR